MASGATVGSAVIKLSFDGKEVKAELAEIGEEMEKSGKSTGTTWANTWSVAAGSLISKGVSKIASSISGNVGRAIERVDTINNFPKVMTALGYSADEANTSIDTIAEAIDGLPTSLDGAVSDVQKLAATMGNLNTGVVNATSVGIALNNMFLAGGKGTEAASNAMEQYNQMLAAGKADMQSWGSMLDAAPGQMKQLAQTLLGATATQEDLRQALNDGTISFDQLNAAIVELNQNGGDGFASFEEQARNATGGIGTAFENVQNRIGKAIAEVVEHIGSERIAEAINNISAGFSNVADVVINIIDFLSANQWIMDAILAFFVGLLGMGIASKIAGLFSMLSTFATTNPVLLAIGAISAVLFLMMTHLEEVGQFWQDVFTNVGNFLTEVGTNIANVFQGIWDFVTGLFSNLASFFGTVFGGAWEAVKAVFSTGGQIFMGIVDGITNAFRTIANAIITGINHVVAIPFNAINGFLSFLKSIDILGIKPFDWVGTIDVPQIPLLAQGGVTTGATQAVIGEAGREVVLPLENNTDNWAGLLASTLVDEMEADNLSSGGGVTIEKQEFYINNEMDAQDIGRVLMQSIRRAA